MSDRVALVTPPPGAGASASEEAAPSRRDARTCRGTRSSASTSCFIGLVYVTVIYVVQVSGLPVNFNLLTIEAPSNVLNRTKRAPPYSDNTMEYLMQFGYLPESDRETGNLRTDSQLRDAIRNLQHFANIPETGVVDEATKAIMRRPRCGLPDVTPGFSRGRTRRYAIHAQKWDHTNLTWSLRTKYFTHLDHGRLRADLHRALHIWAEHSKLSFTEVNSDNADILVYFEKGYHGDGYPFDGKGQILAHAFFPGSGRGGDAHFDIEELWQLIGDEEIEDGTNLFIVAAHEFGHSLGLSHSTVPGALMYPWYQGLEATFELPDDDKYGIQQLYGVHGRLWGKNNGQHPGQRWPLPPTRPTTTTTTTTTRRPTTTRPRIHPDKPDTCDTSYDAISIIRGELFIFKGKYTWRIGEKGLYAGYPALTSRLWNSLPEKYGHIDAVYERHDKKIVFFIGRHYYVYNGNYLEHGYPLHLSHLGLPETLSKIDAAMIWGYNSKTYLFSGTMYWRLDDDTGKVELDYPRDMSMWRGVGYNIDAVFQWKDGITYFFKGKGFWKFDDLRMRVENEKQTSSAQFWMACPPSGTEDPSVNSVPTERTKESVVGDGNPATRLCPDLFISITFLFVSKSIIDMIYFNY